MVCTHIFQRYKGSYRDLRMYCAILAARHHSIILCTECDHMLIYGVTVVIIGWRNILNPYGLRNYTDYNYFVASELKDPI